MWLFLFRGSEISVGLRMFSFSSVLTERESRAGGARILFKDPIHQPIKNSVTYYITKKLQMHCFTAPLNPNPISTFPFHSFNYFHLNSSEVCMGWRVKGNLSKCKPFILPPLQSNSNRTQTCLGVAGPGLSNSYYWVVICMHGLCLIRYVARKLFSNANRSSLYKPHQLKQAFF